MKRIFCIALCVTALAGCGKTSEWRDMEVPEGAFAVLMRGQPHYMAQNLDTPAGNMAVYLYSSDRPDAYFAAGYTDYPLALALSGTSTQIFAGARDTWVKRIGGKLQSSRPITLAGKYPGLEFSAEGTYKDRKSLIEGRLYLVDQRVYQIVAMTRAGEVPQGTVNRYLNSFRLIPFVPTEKILIKPPPVK